MNSSLVQTSERKACGLWPSCIWDFLQLGMETEVTNGSISMNHEGKTPRRDLDKFWTKLYSFCYGRCKFLQGDASAVLHANIDQDLFS